MKRFHDTDIIQQKNSNACSTALSLDDRVRGKERRMVPKLDFPENWSEGDAEMS